MMERRSLLRGYAWLFLASGLFFVLFPGTVIALVNTLCAPLGARPLQDSGRFWLALAGAMMAMISQAAFSLSRDPAQPALWTTLLLSKGTSTLLFVLFALLERDPLLLVGAAVDGPILLHLWFLRADADEDPWASRAVRSGQPFYEVYFAKLNDPATRSALWVRFTVRKSADLVSTGLWCVLFDAPAREVRVEHWEEPRLPESGPADPLLRLGACSLGRGAMKAEGPAAWDLSWKPHGPGWDFLPDALRSLGAAKSCYLSPMSAGRFEGRVRMGEKHLWFSEAWGSVGHLWGRGMAEDWRWAHAVFPGKEAQEAAVFEILSARARLGPVLTPRMTSANLFFRGRVRRSLGPVVVWKNSTWEDKGGWSFRADFGDLVAEGLCLPDPAMTAEAEYDDPAGGKLLCRNCGVSALRLRLTDKSGAAAAELDTPDGAAVETVVRR